MQNSEELEILHPLPKLHSYQPISRLIGISTIILLDNAFKINKCRAF